MHQVEENQDLAMVMPCPHCGNKTILHERATYSFEDDYSETGGPVITTSWIILQCAACLRPIMEESRSSYYEAGFFDGDPTITLYPAPRRTLDFTKIPLTINRAYQAALSVRDIEPNALAVLVGRTLETACNHEKAQGKSLADKLKYLAVSGRIPQTLAEMGQQLRELRNLGAHDAEDEVSKEDIPIIMDFLEAILEYLYIAPAKVEALRARLKKIL